MLLFVCACLYIGNALFVVLQRIKRNALGFWAMHLQTADILYVLYTVEWTIDIRTGGRIAIFFFRPIFRWDQASISHLSTKLFQIHHKPFFRRNKYFDRLFIDFFKVRGEFIEKKMRIYR